MILRHVLVLGGTAVMLLCVWTTSTGCGSGCDAEKRCSGKNNALITGGKIIPICDATTERDGSRYSWATDSGTCSCTLDQSIAGSFWRNCTFDGSKKGSPSPTPTPTGTST